MPIAPLKTEYLEEDGVADPCLNSRHWSARPFTVPKAYAVANL